MRHLMVSARTSSRVILVGPCLYSEAHWPYRCLTSSLPLTHPPCELDTYQILDMQAL
mgnify:FL=1